MRLKFFTSQSLVLLALCGQAHAAWNIEPYFPPEALVPPRYRERLALAPLPIDLNRATLAELMTLPGIDESLALQLLEARPFASLKDIGGLRLMRPWQAEALLDRLRPFVTVKAVTSHASTSVYYQNGELKATEATSPVEQQWAEPAGHQNQAAPIRGYW